MATWTKPQRRLVYRVKSHARNTGLQARLPVARLLRVPLPCSGAAVEAVMAHQGRCMVFPLGGLCADMSAQAGVRVLPKARERGEGGRGLARTCNRGPSVFSLIVNVVSSNIYALTLT